MMMMKQLTYFASPDPRIKLDVRGCFYKHTSRPDWLYRLTTTLVSMSVMLGRPGEPYHFEVHSLRGDA